MSLDRLGAIVRRGAARVGVVAEQARPAFDPLLALDSAAVVVAARDIAPRRAPKGGSATAPVTPAAPARARQAASAPEPVSAQARSRPAGAPEVAPVARPAIAATPGQQAASPTPLAVMTVVSADAARADEVPGDLSGHPSAAAPLEAPRGIAPAPPQGVMRGASRAPPDHATTDRATDRAVSASPAVAAIPAIAPVLPPPPQPPADPQVARTAPPEPRITIEQIEVVMAPAPKPTPTPRPAATPDRGFARYAAMRSARDRARW